MRFVINVILIVFYILLFFSLNARAQSTLDSNYAELIRIAVVFPSIPSQYHVDTLTAYSRGDLAAQAFAEPGKVEGFAEWYGKSIEEAKTIVDELKFFAPMQRFEYFPIISLITTRPETNLIRKAFPEAKIYDIGWERKELAISSYLRILMSIEYAIKRKDIDIINVSLGGSVKDFDPYEPMNIATKAAVDSGIIVIVSAGNDGPDTATLNPWSVAPWVLGIGAASKNGKEIWPRSSRGRPSNSLCKPDLVAPGIDIEIPAPPDYSRTRSYTGTSFAAGNVSRLAAYILLFLWELQYELEINGCGNIPVKPAIVRNIFLDMAQPINAESYAAGRGFVDLKALTDYLARFDLGVFVQVFETTDIDTICVRDVLQRPASGKWQPRMPGIMIPDTGPDDPEHPIGTLIAGPLVISDSTQYRQVEIFFPVGNQ